MKKSILVFVLFFTMNTFAFAETFKGPYSGLGTDATGNESLIVMKPGDIIEDATIDARGYHYGVTFTDRSGTRIIRRTSIKNAEVNGIHIIYDNVDVEVKKSFINLNKQNGIYVDGKILIEVEDTTVNFNGRIVTDCDGIEALENSARTGDPNRCNHGIDLRGGATLWTDELIAQYNGIAGVWVSDAATIARINNSTLSDNAIGLFAAFASTTTIRGSNINNNNNRGNPWNPDWGTGVYINNAGTQVSIYDSTISGNKFFNVYDVATESLENRTEDVQQAILAGRNFVLINKTTIKNSEVGVAVWDGNFLIENVSHIIDNAVGFRTGIDPDCKICAGVAGANGAIVDTIFTNNMDADIEMQGRFGSVLEVQGGSLDPAKVFIGPGDVLTYSDPPTDP